jgi:hypothetical protein
VLNLDNDACGDLNQGEYNKANGTAVTFTIPSVKCAAPASGGTNVHLPYCTSWHSNQGTVCNAVDGTTLAGKFTHAPDTKSKCTCGDLVLPIVVRNADATVTKKATQADVTYTVTVKNTSGFAVNITDLNDTV